MLKLTTSLMLCLVSLIACNAEVQPPDTERLAAELLQADVDFATLSMQSDPKQAFAAFLAPNAIMIPRAGDPLEGYDAAVASFGDEPVFKLHWQPKFSEVAASGDLGWTWGTYQLLVQDRQVSKGKYVNIWALQEDGSWKVRMDMGNQEPQ